jgi:heat shock protein HslJ
MMLASCGSEPSTGGSLDGRSFLSVSVSENGKPKELAPNTRIGLRFEGGNVHAETGCNQLGGEVSTDGGKLTVDQLGGTEMGCDPARHAQEDWVGQLLRDRPEWKLDADKLTLTRGTTTLVLQDRQTAQPDKALDGTRWTLESIVSGQTASHIVGSERAFLTISGERVTGSTGCNDFQGVVARTAGKVTFGELSITTAACSGDVAKLEGSVIAALRGELTYTIEANRLQLRAADGNGLDLTAG